MIILLFNIINRKSLKEHSKNYNMNLTQEELTELQRRIKVYQETPNMSIKGVNQQYEAKKNIDAFSREMSIKYGYDYMRFGINSKTGEIIPL